MEKENSATGSGGGSSGGGGGGGSEATVTSGATSTPEHLQADQANSLLDPTALFGAYWPRGDGGAASSLFAGMPAGYGLAGHHLPSAYAILGRNGGTGGASGNAGASPAGAFGAHGAGSAAGPPSYSHAGLGSLGVSASQAASLGMNSASAAWWSMATHLATQEYLARLQGAAAAAALQPGFPPGAESLLPPYPSSLLAGPGSTASSHHHPQSHSHSHSHTTSSASSSSSSAHKSSHKSKSAKVSHKPSIPVNVPGPTPVAPAPAPSPAPPPAQPSVVSDPSSILGGVRLPPDTEIIKYTSSIVGPKVPGTTNRGRKKTISLDSPSVSLHQSSPGGGASLTSSSGSGGLLIEPSKHSRSKNNESNSGSAGANEYREPSLDRVEVIKLPAHSTNGSILPVTSNYSGSSSNNAGGGSGSNAGGVSVNSNEGANSRNSRGGGSSLGSDADAPLNLSLKPSSRGSGSPIAGNQPLSQLSSLSQSLLASDRISRRKPGPKPRRVPQNSSTAMTPIPASPSLAQLFAAADSPQRSGSGGEENESSSHHHQHQQHKDRPRNLGRGVSKPKKNTVASLLAQSRALGIKPTPGLDPSIPLSHQVSLLRSNILAAQLQHASAFGQLPPDDKNQQAFEQLLQRSLQEKMKNKLMEASGEESNMDVTSESGSNTDVLSDTDDDNAEGTAGPKKRKLNHHSDKELLQIPLDRGWKRETVIKGLGRTGVIKGDVTYFSPCGKIFRSSSELLKFIEMQNVPDLTAAHFSFSSRPLVGDFLQPTMGLTEAEFVRLGSQEVSRRLEELKAVAGFRDVRANNQYERDKLAYAKRLAKEEALRHKEQARLLKEQEKTERQEAVRRERELRNQQLLEARKKRQEEVEKIRIEEQQRKQQERELKRQQAVILKEQMYMQELTKQREMLYTVELERERRRQHMTLIRALENRRKLEEREKKRLEARAERIASKEKRAEQRRLELELVEQIRKPVEDMELTDHKPLPELRRVPGLKLSGQAFADLTMVFEFLHNFGETLGFDMDSLPSLRSLQAALLNDEEAEEELLSVMTHLLVCAIEDPGIPQPARHTTGLGQSLRQADITHANISEVLRIYLYANATGEVKALTGVCLERERDKRYADHHQNAPTDNGPHSGSSKNAQFYEHLHNNETWRMSERLRDKPFLALNPTHKAQMLAFLCNELLQNKAVLKQIEQSLENVAQLKKDRFLIDTKIRKLRQLHARKQRMEAVGVIVNKSADGISLATPVVAVTPVTPAPTGTSVSNVAVTNADANATTTATVTTTATISTATTTTTTATETTNAVATTTQTSSTSTSPAAAPNKKAEGEGTNDSAQQPNSSSPSPLPPPPPQSLPPPPPPPPPPAPTATAATNTEETHNDDEAHDEDMSENESEGTQPEEEEDKNLSAEELGKKLEKLLKQSEEQLQKLNSSSKELRAHIFGQDRYWRRYWELPCAGGIFVEAMESAEPEVLTPQAELDQKYELMPKKENEIKAEDDQPSQEKVEQSNGIENESQNDKQQENDQQEVNDVAEKNNESESESPNTEEKPVTAENDSAEQMSNNSKNEQSNCTTQRTPKKNAVSHIKKETNTVALDNGENNDDNDHTREKDQDHDRSHNHKKDHDNDHDNTDHNDEDLNHDHERSTSHNHGHEHDNGEDADDDDDDDDDDVDDDDDDERQVKPEIKTEKVTIKVETEQKEKENGSDDTDDVKIVAIKKENDKIAETITNGDKFNHVGDLHNGKELNGTFNAGEIVDNSYTEVNWFSILPRETCDTPGASTKHLFGITDSTELKIPIFPPPASPNYDRCDSPAPLVLTQDEATQLEYLKVHGLPPPGEAKPVPKDLRYGWWRITDVEVFQELLEHLHSRGVREKELKRTTWATMESFLAVTGKLHVDPGNQVAIDLSDCEDSTNDPPVVPKSDDPEDWNRQVANRVDAQLLEQVEALEDKVANASMQVKGWKLPPRSGTEEAEELEKLNEMEQVSAVEQARQRLLSLEAAIERRYLKPPLGVCTGDPNLAALKAEQAAAVANANASSSSTESGSASGALEENTPRGLNNWREATARAHTSAQLAMALYMLEASIAWDKSIMKANCQFCHSGDNEDKLLLCDGCDRGYHTYCFRPKMENIPDGDWYCHECMNKATGERNCLVCGKRVGKNLVLCELCPRAYHTDCHNPVMPKMPRGKWYCSNCHSKQPKKRNSSRRSHKGEKGGGTRDSESSDHPPASPTPSTASNAHVEDVSSSELPTPTTSPRKEVNVGKALTKKQQRELAPCKILLEQLEQQDEAWPFLLPVNTKQFPTYKKIIKTPMDLSTIKKKLQDCVYKSRDDFCADVRQMFINCEVFNEDDSPVGKAGHGMRNFFETRWTELTGAPPPIHPQTHS